MQVNVPNETWILVSGRTRLKLTLKDFKIAPDIIWRIIKIALPALLMNAQRSFANFVLTWVIAPYGTVAVAAQSLASRAEMFIFMPAPSGLHIAEI